MVLLQRLLTQLSCTILAKNCTRPVFVSALSRSKHFPSCARQLRAPPCPCMLSERFLLSASNDITVTTSLLQGHPSPT